MIYSRCRRITRTNLIWSMCSLTYQKSLLYSTKDSPGRKDGNALNAYYKAFTSWRIPIHVIQAISGEGLGRFGALISRKLRFLSGRFYEPHGLSLSIFPFVFCFCSGRRRRMAIYISVISWRGMGSLLRLDRCGCCLRPLWVNRSVQVCMLVIRAPPKRATHLSGRIVMVHDDVGFHNFNFV